MLSIREDYKLTDSAESNHSFTVKQYPLRNERETQMVDICSCGHAWFYHDGKCEECTCPKYEFQQRLSNKDARELRWKIFFDNKEKGFEQ